MSWSIGSFQTASSANVPLPISRMNLPLTKPEAIQPMINDYATTNGLLLELYRSLCEYSQYSIIIALFV